MTTTAVANQIGIPILDLGHYLAWHAGEGTDLCSMLIDRGVDPGSAQHLTNDALSKRSPTVVKRTRDHRAILAFILEDVWTVWDFRLDQPFENEVAAHEAGKASDALAEARGDPPPVWTVVDLAMH
jgi:hypothetical protein